MVPAASTISGRGAPPGEITGGGAVKTGTLVYMGQLTGGTSIVNVNDAGPQWIASGTLDVGSPATER